MSKKNLFVIMIVVLLLIPIPYFQNNRSVICKQGNGCHGESGVKFTYPAIIYFYYLATNQLPNALRKLACSIITCQTFVNFPNPKSLHPQKK